ncbi:MAG TPA: hypothetical protein VIM77_10320, partial [Mucilaginibacter sp.]
PRVAMKLRAMGVVPGVYDIHIFYRNSYHIIDFKHGYSNLSDAQEKWGTIMQSQGAKNHRAIWTVHECIGIVVNDVLKLSADHQAMQRWLNGYYMTEQERKRLSNL